MLFIKTNYRTIQCNEKRIKLMNRANKGTSLKSLLKFKKDEYISFNVAVFIEEGRSPGPG